jgi:hypothetical protein
MSSTVNVCESFLLKPILFRVWIDNISSAVFTDLIICKEMMQRIWGREAVEAAALICLA